MHHLVELSNSPFVYTIGHAKNPFPLLDMPCVMIDLLIQTRLDVLHVVVISLSFCFFLIYFFAVIFYLLEQFVNWIWFLSQHGLY